MTPVALSPAPLGAVLARGLAALVWLGILAALAPAAAATCETLAPGRVVVQPVYPSPALDLSLDLAGLRQRAQAPDAQHGEFVQPLGLTVAKLVESLEADGDFAEADPRAAAHVVCGVATEVRVRIGFEDAVIYIAREVARDRCLYGEVYRHEERHVQVDRNLVDLFAPHIVAGLRTLIARIGVVRAPSADAAWALIRDRLGDAVKTDLEALEQEMHRRQAVIDLPEEYRRISTVCGGAGGRLVAGARRPG